VSPIPGWIQNDVDSNTAKEEVASKAVEKATKVPMPFTCYWLFS
jgi:hypothetical protein